MRVDILLNKCNELQWSIGEFDWDKEGKEKVSKNRALEMKSFLSDLVWIEYIAFLVFDNMAKNTKDQIIKGIFESFAKDEKRHAEAELALMHRWGIAKKGEMPEANLNIKILVGELEKYPEYITPSVAAAIVPMTELVLDGALVKYLLHTIEDPLCHEVFAKINADESRHLAMDFYMLEKFGAEYNFLTASKDFSALFLNPISLYPLLFGYIPLLTRAGKNIDRMGLDKEEINKCLEKYISQGETKPVIKNHPFYIFFREYAKKLKRGDHSGGEFFIRVSEQLENLKFLQKN